MGCYTLEGNPPIDVTLRRSRRAKRLSLRVSRLDGRVTLTLPNHAREREGLSFLKEREPWLRGHLAQLAPVAPVRIGGTVPFEGLRTPITASTNGRASITDGQILIRSESAAGPQVRALLKQRARDALARASDRFAAELGVVYSRLSLRDTRSRWGSCSSTGTLMYSWRLIMAPPNVLEYVAAHETAHLVEMNHSARFWAVVQSLYPGYDTQRRWLRENGDQLHRLDFGD